MTKHRFKNHKLQWDGLQWSHPDHEGVLFNGSFHIDSNFNRTFILFTENEKRFVYRDWRDAVRDGWVKQKYKKVKK